MSSCETPCPDPVIVGNSLIFRATFKNLDDELFNPVDVLCRVRASNGVVTTYDYGVDPEIINPSTGVFETTVLLETAGRWRYRYEAVDEDGNEVASEGSVLVEASKVI